VLERCDNQLHHETTLKLKKCSIPNHHTFVDENPKMAPIIILDVSSKSFLFQINNKMSKSQFLREYKLVVVGGGGTFFF
jgi:superoxide dismutase